MVAASSTPAAGVVLVVTPADSATNALSALLREHRPTFVVAESAAEAMRRVATEPCGGVVVSDALEDATPAECIGALRVMSPDLPVILLSRSGNAGTIVEALRAGADAYVADGDSADTARVLDALLGRLAEKRTRSIEDARIRESAATYAPDDLGERVRRTAHDMNQPLTVIFGLVDVLMLDAMEDRSMHEDLLTLQREAERLRVMARSLVRLSSGIQSPAGNAGA